MVNQRPRTVSSKEFLSRIADQLDARIMSHGRAIQDVRGMDCDGPMWTNEEIVALYSAQQNYLAELRSAIHFHCGIGEGKNVIVTPHPRSQ